MTPQVVQSEYRDRAAAASCFGSDEYSFDAIDRAADEMRELGEDWENWLTIQRHSIAENYAEGRLALICDLNIRLPETYVVRCRVREDSTRARRAMFQSTLDGGLKFIPGGVNREFSVLGPSSNSREFHVVKAEIKSAHQVVDDIPDDKQDFLWGRLVRSDLKDTISRLRIVLDQDTVAASVGEGSPLQVKIIDVLIGPLDF
jgi:hypothetical protein